MDGLTFGSARFDRLQLKGDFILRERAGGFQGVLDCVVGSTDASHLLGNGLLLLGDPLLDGKQLLLQDSSRGGLNSLTHSLPTVPYLLVGVTSLSFGLSSEDLLRELAVLVQSVAESLREDLSFIFCCLIAGGRLFCLGLLGDPFGLCASHFELKNYLNKDSKQHIHIPHPKFITPPENNQKFIKDHRKDEPVFDCGSDVSWGAFDSQQGHNYFILRMQHEKTTNRYFFELIPIHLNRISKKNKRKLSNYAQLKFALFLQNRKVAESREWLPLQWNKDVFTCTKSSLDFYLANFNHNFYSNFTLKAIAREPPSLRIEQEPDRQDICRIEEPITQLGSFQLDPGVYIDTFNDDHKALFQENMEISPQYSIDYELYIERTRFGLQRLIRQSRGANTEANILATAFKKRSGKKKVRYVELNDSGERSVKQQQFKKNKKALISSLKKSGNKYVPQKTVQNQSSSSRNVTPHKPQKQGLNDSSSLASPCDISNLKLASRIPDSESSLQESRGQKLNMTTPRITRDQQFERSVIHVHSELDSSLLVNRVRVQKCTQKLLLFAFWGVAFSLLYLTMMPSKKA